MRSGKHNKYIQLKKLLIFVFVVCISAGIFITLYITSLSDRDLVLVHVNSISIEGIPIKDQECTITLNGTLPNPCWRLDHHEKEIYEQEKSVNISLWGYLGEGGCIEIPISYQYNVSMIFPSSGNWTIACNRISKNIIVLD
jgi:hypothetical protein